MRIKYIGNKFFKYRICWKIYNSFFLVLAIRFLQNSYAVTNNSYKNLIQNKLKIIIMTPSEPSN